EFIKVAAVDAEELEALEERGAGVERLMQDAAVELEPAQLAVDVERRMPDVEVEQGRRWCWRCRGRGHRLDHRHDASVTTLPSSVQSPSGMSRESAVLITPMTMPPRSAHQIPST